MEKNNYGASEPISLAVIGAKLGALVGKKALAAGGKALLKGGGKKLLKKGGEKVVKEGGKKLFKKSAEKIAKKGKEKLIKKAGKEFIKSDKGKQLAKNARKSKVEGKINQFKESKLGLKVDELGMKAKNFSQNYQNDNLTSVKKIADKTGMSYDDTLENAKNLAGKAGTAGINAIQSRKQQETPADASSFVSSADEKITQESGEKEVALSGYANPQGPSAYFNKNAGPSMRQGFKYDNTGACLPLQAKSKTTSGDLKTNKPIFSSLDKKNIMVNNGASSSLASLSGSNIKTTKKRNPFEYLKGFDANVNIRGFKVNIGQAAQIAGLLGKGALTAGKKFGDYTKKRKQLKNTKASSTTPKNRPALAASNEKKFSNIAQNNTGGFNYLTKGFKPGGKVSDQDASIFKQNKNK
tara:strand:+ start:97 stop:1326 length:1230 start_codon:yes stop_codon:yes gene_type:complete